MAAEVGIAALAAQSMPAGPEPKTLLGPPSARICRLGSAALTDVELGEPGALGQRGRAVVADAVAGGV